MKESSFDVEVLHVPIIDGSNVHQGTKRLKASCRSRCFVVINEVALGKPLGNIMDFVSGDVARIVPLPLANELPF